MSRKAQIDDRHRALRRRRRFSHTLRPVDRQGTQMGLKLIQCVIQDTPPVLDHNATLPEARLLPV
ncbi:hypothetical protein Ato02nite_023480 [Paractinoplanes toevensis]|uniref:Uncharacterized protein n=1 Tax=Paractinoplanes toevensis TaxID=571911 RepID=A0A919T7Q9_9ACTN|nr:hypothetical protein Ato02nite_023480 [Actinoplanes toevensis]